MNKNVMVVGAVLLVVVVGGGAYIASRGPSASPYDTKGDSTSEENTEVVGGTYSGSLADLGKRGGNYECTFSHISNAGDSSGVVYVSGKNMRGDFQSVAHAAGGFSVESHMIAKDGFTYTWTPLSPSGFRARVVEGETGGGAATEGAYADQNQIYEYECSPWSVDESKFTPPAIPFVDVN